MQNINIIIYVQRWEEPNCLKTYFQGLAKLTAYTWNEPDLSDIC